MWKGVCRKLTKLYGMWKEFDLPVVNNPAVGPVTEVSPAAAAAVEAIAPVADTHVNCEAGGSDQAEDTHDSMQEVQEEEPEPQEGTTQAHVNESDDPAPYPNGPSTLKRTYFWKIKSRPSKIANKTLGPGKHLHWFGFWFQSPDGDVVKDPELAEAHRETGDAWYPNVDDDVDDDDE